MKKEFAVFGPVEGVRIVRNKITKKSRGYAFVVFKNEKDADCKSHILLYRLDAVSRADGRRIEGRKIIVDRELGRTRKDWLPRRLGGGKGDSRRDRKDEDLIKKLKYELEQEDKGKGKTPLDKLQEKSIEIIKTEGAEDAAMAEKPLAESEKESSTEKKRMDRSRSRSRERERSHYHADDYRHSRKYERKHHRDDYSHERAHRYNSHI